MPVDNQFFQIKLNLRLEYIRRYGGVTAFDCCQGSMRLWSEILKEYPNIKYFGVDKKPKPGRHKVDSSRILEIENLSWDIVDIDTYGDPWKHYINLCKNTSCDVTVFLTNGKGAGKLSNVSNTVCDLLHIPENTPQTLRLAAVDNNIDRVIHSCIRYGIIATDIIEVKPSDTVCYYAMRLKKQENVL